MRILVVEDEPKVAQALKTGLSGEGYEVTLAATGEDGFFLISSAAFDFVILDIMLPGRDGLEMLAAMRKLGQSTPVLILSARDTVDDRIKGLDLGADDYLVKPFAFDELLARIRALLRRGRPEETLRLKAEEKGQQIEVAVSSLMVLGDPAVLRQAVVNILDNAIKYSPPDRTIRVVAELRGEEVVLEIIDSGPGIAVEHREKVFDRFYRVDPARSRETGGFGLGLAIARWAVVANGGRLEVDSRPGGGSVFRIALPSEMVAKAPISLSSEAPR